MTWTWWMTLLAIFAALVLIGCIPVGVDARYNAEGVFLAAKLGPIRLQLLPQQPKKKKKQQKQQKKPEKAPEKAASQEKKPNPILSGGVDEILQLLDMPIHISQFRDFITVSRTGAITRLNTEQWAKLRTLIANMSSVL